MSRPYIPKTPKELAALDRPDIVRLIQTNAVVCQCFHWADTYARFMEMAVVQLAAQLAVPDSWLNGGPSSANYAAAASR